MNNFKAKLISWIRLARFQFYPMIFIIYSLGALYSYSNLNKFNTVSFFLGYFCLFLIEFITIICNEYFDLTTDQMNKNRSLFNGGSGVLVQKRINSKEIVIVGSVSLFFLGAAMVFISPGQNNTGMSHYVIAVLLTGFILGIGYTMPPLKFSYRGIGEFVVAFTCGPYIIFCGAYFQSGRLFDPGPWIFGLPLFFAILPAILLSEIADYEADRSTGKRTIPVILGKDRALLFIIFLLFVPNLTSIILWYYHLLSDSAVLILFIAFPHAVTLSVFCLRRTLEKFSQKSYSGLVAASLVYIVWFGIIPYISILIDFNGIV